MRHTPRSARPGAAAVEMALVLPVLMILLMGLIVGGVGVFRYQQVACQAREAARWASVRGGDYQKDTGAASPTRQQIIDQVVLPLAAGMDPASLSVAVAWVDRAAGTATDWDASPKDVRSVNGAGNYVTNAVRVTVSFQWSAGLFGGPLTMRSVCELPLAQ